MSFLQSKQKALINNSETTKKIEIGLLRQVLDLRRNGHFDRIEISGADPLEYDKIVPFIGYLKSDLGFKEVILSTHGRYLHDLTLVKKLSKAGLDRLRVPFYGSKDIIHDAVTQEKGSFQQTLKGIQNVYKYAPHIHLTISSLIMKQNYKDIINIFLLACRYSSLIYFSIPYIKDFSHANKFAISLEKMKPYLKSLLAQTDAQKKPLEIMDIPFCVFGYYKKNIINRTGPPVTSIAYSIPSHDRSAVWGLPAYRKKKKLSICKVCILNEQCDGFYVRYLRLFGFKGCEPILHSTEKC